MAEKISSRPRWALAEGAGDTGTAPGMPVRDDVVAIANPEDEAASVALTIFCNEAGPWGPYLLTVEANATLRVPLADLIYPEPLPSDYDYACIVESDHPVVVERDTGHTSEAVLHSRFACPLD